jgi:TolA-binding protein
VKTIDLHPDELLDKARRGELSADERVRLDAHLAHCVACRFECAVQRDFAADAQRASEVDGLQALVSGALRAAGQSEAPAARAPVPLRGRRSRWALAWAATLLLVSGVATAQTGLMQDVLAFARTRVESLLGTRAAEPARTPRAARSKPAVAPLPAHAATSARQPSADASLAAAEPAPPGIEEAPRAAPPPAVPRLQGRKARGSQLPQPARASGSATSAPAPRAVPGAVAPPYVPASAAPPAEPVLAASNDAPGAVATPAPRGEPSPAAALFERANALRRAGQAHAAAVSYRELGARYPQSPEALLSLVLLGRLELDRGDARAALARFDAYLASGEQALREQALADRALSLSRLGREGAACAAFAELLRAYPSSAYASLAQARCDGD